MARVTFGTEDAGFPAVCVRFWPGVLVCLLVTTSAQADPLEPPATRTVGYGWGVVALDAGALALEAVAFGLSQSDHDYGNLPTILALSGSQLYLFGAPTLHFTQGQPHNAGWSVLLRLGAPLTTGATAWLVATATCHDPEPDPNYPDESWCKCACGAVIWGALGGAVGVVAAMAVDAAVIARKPAAPARAWNLVPTYEPRTRAVGLALTGSMF